MKGFGEIIVSAQKLYIYYIMDFIDARRDVRWEGRGFLREIRVGNLA